MATQPFPSTVQNSRINISSTTYLRNRKKVINRSKLCLLLRCTKFTIPNLHITNLKSTLRFGLYNYDPDMAKKQQQLCIKLILGTWYLKTSHIRTHLACCSFSLFFVVVVAVKYTDLGAPWGRVGCAPRGPHRLIPDCNPLDCNSANPLPLALTCSPKAKALALVSTPLHSPEEARPRRVPLRPQDEGVL